MQLLRRQQWETVVEVVAALRAEDADGTGACSVALLRSFLEDTVKYISVLLHLGNLRFDNIQFTIYWDICSSKTGS